MSEPLVTVLYYTSNREPEEFEKKVMANILKHKGDLPLVSVSQKPLPGFGHNICVGEQGNCYHNEFRQIQIGLKEVKTPYVLHAEADFLYPPEYFQFVPPEPRNYRYDNVWVMYTNPNHRAYYIFKRRSIGAELNHTQSWLDRLNFYLKDRPLWMDSDKAMPLSRNLTFKDNSTYVWTGAPIITFKTGFGVNRFTNVPKGIRPKRRLPFWGSAYELRKEMCE